MQSVSTPATHLRPTKKLDSLAAVVIIASCYERAGET